jgi:hypothetical protein
MLTKDLSRTRAGGGTKSLSRKDLEMLTKYPSIKVFCQHGQINKRE